MPAVYMFSDSRARVEAVKSLNLFDEEQFLLHVMQPVMATLGVTRAELRKKGRKGCDPVMISV
jgi:hypothetical protein